MLRLLRFLAFSLLLALAGVSVFGQTLSVSTLAGSTNGGGHNDDFGVAARFSSPEGVAVNSNGDIYVADPGNHVIRRVTLDGSVTTIAGMPGESGTADGAGPDARFTFPSGVAFGPGGTLYVADSVNHTIRAISAVGLVTTVAGLARTSGTADGPKTVARFTYPQGLDVDAQGNIYVADTSNHVIRKISPSGDVTTLAGTKRSQGSDDGFGSQARFNYPWDVAVDSVGNVLVADSSNHIIRKVTPEGRVTTLAGAPPSDGEAHPGSTDGLGTAARFNFPDGIDVDQGGIIYVSDYSNHTIRRVTAAAEVTTIAGLAGSRGIVDGTGSSARFHKPAGVAVSGSGVLIVADEQNHVIRRIGSGQQVSTLAGSAPQSGSTNGQGTSARFLTPTDVVADALGNLFVADAGNHVIRRISPSGVVTTFAGQTGSSGSTDGTSSTARFNTPYGVALDPGGNLFVADARNHVVRRITPSGNVSTFAGAAGQAGYMEGSGAQARFDMPLGITTDSLGYVYVADTNNNVIRVIEPGGIVSTFAGSTWSGDDDGIGRNASFDSPVDIAADNARNLYVADWGNDSIRKITQSGVVTTIKHPFSTPHGVDVRGDGTLFVTDTGNQTIARVDPDGTVTTVAGRIDSAGNVNGVGGAARFFRPEGIALDKSGRVLIADAYNNAIRVGIAAAPTIKYFTATPSRIQPGQSATLSWDAADATTATVDHGIGGVTPYGFRYVSPQATTTYTLAVTGDGGTTSAKVTVYVGSARKRVVSRP